MVQAQLAWLTVDSDPHKDAYIEGQFVIRCLSPVASEGK